MKVFKLTSQSLQTHNDFQWEVGKWYEASGTGDLCSDGWLHAYTDPRVAVFMNPAHAGISNPILWEAEAEGKFLDDHGLKCGYSRMRLVRKIPLPVISTEQRIKIAINCAIIAGYDDENWITWALHWMDGSDRSEEAAEAAAGAAEAASWVAWATRAAAWAARAAVWAARVAEAAAGAGVAAGARVAARAVQAAAGVAEAVEFDLAKLLHEICD